MTRHTPAPGNWSLIKERYEYALGEFEDRYEINDAENFTICIVDDRAKAELIVAAPEMLDALILCEDALSELARLDDGTPSISALIAARSAIARAKGRRSAR